ncbi:unnamed protein product [Blepharisma stoltei]|uniref:diphthine methyl ester synthase n=1 Tax=Blepharisma stoltei TaxID=1481888 RepID=A0AAU9IJ52_9CILI|nr:unnamed protein product [Blepharisma stoltei]
MVLYFIGLGLGDEKDITVKGLEAVQKSTYIYLESYTSCLITPKSKLEEFYGKPIIEADRIMVESGCDEMLERAKNNDVSFLVVGDPFCATTHSDLFMRAAKLHIQLIVIHNASIFTAIGYSGLQLYKFGETVSVPFFTERWRPYSFYNKILENKRRGLHTLVLLDIKVKEQSEEDLMRGRLVFQPPRFMTANIACQQILEAEDNTQSGLIQRNDLVIGLLRMGTPQQTIVVKPIEEMANMENLGDPLHSLIIPGELHEIEQEMMQFHSNTIN